MSTSAAGQVPAGRPHAAAAPVCRAWRVNGKTRTKLAARMARDIENALSGRADEYAVRVKDPHLGVGCGINPRLHIDSASAVKATILAALLHKVQLQHRSLTANEKNLAWYMITQSDNNAATALWDDVGRASLQHFLNLAKMKETVLGPGGYWGLTQLTAHDETLLLWRLLQPSKLLTKAHRRYELYLMANVIPSQRWGVPAGAPAKYTVHVKNGWAQLTGPDWTVNSIGCFTHSDLNYSIVVLTQGTPAGGTLAYGITTIEDVSTVVHRDLNPGATAVVPRSRPNPSWDIPDEPIPPQGTGDR